VKRIINANRELKYFGHVQDYFSVTTTPVLTGVPFDVPQGDEDQERDGDQLTLAGKINFRMAMKTNGSTRNVVRVIFFQWKDMSFVTPYPTTSEVLFNGPTGAIDVYSQYNHDTRFNYTILFDKTYTLVGTGVASAVTTYPFMDSSVITRNYHISLKKAKRVVQYRAAGGQATNRIFMIYLSDIPTGSSPPTMTFTSKMFFYDS
jgi:hypothetical protein